MPQYAQWKTAGSPSLQIQNKDPGGGLGPHLGVKLVCLGVEMGGFRDKGVEMAGFWYI